MLEKLGFFLALAGGNFYITGHLVWGTGTLVVAGLFLRDSGIPGSLWAKAIGDFRRRLQWKRLF